MKTFLVFLIVWLALSAISYIAGSFIFDSSFMNRMVKEGKQTHGVVIGKDAENHRTLQFVYDVDGVTYERSGFSGESNPDFDEIQIGDRVIVVFDPVDPDSAILGLPEDTLGALYLGRWFVTLTIPIIPMCVFLGVYLIFKNGRRLKSP